MKAVYFNQYGTPDVLKLIETEKPTPKDNEVLIKVNASSVNSWDWDLLRGKPFFIRLLWGLFKPKYKILGADIAGCVEMVGKDITRFKPGDEVFGDLCESGWGGFSQYVCATENALTLKPDNLTFEQAAAVPQAAVMALQGLCHKGQLQAKQKVLIIGAGGGVGSFAIQIAKNFDAHVTGVDSTKKLDFMKSIGADEVIDYTQEDFTKTGEQYDIILDVAAHRSIFDYKRILRSNGIYIMVGGATNRIFQIMVLGPLISLIGNKKMGILPVKPNKGLETIKEMLELGKIVPAIGKHYTLQEVPEAFHYYEKGLIQGKIVISIE